MSSYRISIVELNPRPAVAESTGPVSGLFEEMPIFSQVVADISVSRLIRQINSAPRRRKATKGAASAQ